MFTKFEINIPTGKYEIGKIQDGYDGLDIEIFYDDQSYTIHFDDKMLYRVLNESVTTNEMWANCDVAWPAYEGSTSTEFFEFFIKNGGEVYEGLEYKHYRIVGQEEIVDVITNSSPVLKES